MYTVFINIYVILISIQYIIIFLYNTLVVFFWAWTFYLLAQIFVILLVFLMYCHRKKKRDKIILKWKRKRKRHDYFVWKTKRCLFLTWWTKWQLIMMKIQKGALLTSLGNYSFISSLHFRSGSIPSLSPSFCWLHKLYEYVLPFHYWSHVKT